MYSSSSSSDLDRSLQKMSPDELEDHEKMCQRFMRIFDEQGSDLLVDLPYENAILWALEQIGHIDHVESMTLTTNNHPFYISGFAQCGLFKRSVRQKGSMSTYDFNSSNV